MMFPPNIAAALARQQAWGSINLIDFTAAPRAGGVYTAMHPALTLTCATTGRTSRQSATTLAVGLGANAARAHSADGAAWGLLTARAMTNVVPYSLAMTGTGWGAGSMTRVTGKADPAGGTSAIEFTSLNVIGTGKFSNYCSPLVTGRTVSAWARSVSGSEPTAHLEGSPTDATYASVSGAAWSHISATMSAEKTGYCNFDTRAGSPTGAPLLDGTRVCETYGLQYEAGMYPTPMLPTGAGGSSAAADILSAPAPSIAPGGYLDNTYAVRPLFASTEQGVDADLLNIDAGAIRLFLRQSDRKWVLRIGGADVVSAAQTWARNDLLTIRAQHTPAGRTLTVAGVPVTGSAVSPIAIGPTAYLLGDASGAQECWSLQSLAVAGAG